MYLAGKVSIVSCVGDGNSTPSVLNDENDSSEKCRLATVPLRGIDITRYDGSTDAVHGQRTPINRGSAADESLNGRRPWFSSPSVGLNTRPDRANVTRNVIKCDTRQLPLVRALR